VISIKALWFACFKAVFWHDTRSWFADARIEHIPR